VADEILTNDWRGPGDAISINEHKQHCALLGRKREWVEPGRHGKVIPMAVTL
jgi:hypothetical protein